jgi:SMI1 / KNR4 family (SUKH-1)
MNEVLWLVRRQLKSRLTDQDSRIGTRLLHKAEPTSLENDEAQLGFRVPPLLKRLYLEIGNGGFGPGYGLIGMTGGEPDDTGKTAPESYLELRSAQIEEPGFCWPRSLLPICHWGCAILSCVSCDGQDYPMYIFDPNGHLDGSSWKDAFFEEAPTFESWITAWAEGVDLWSKSYGQNGQVTKALAERAQSA